MDTVEAGFECGIINGESDEMKLDIRRRIVCGESYLEIMKTIQSNWTPRIGDSIACCEPVYEGLAQSPGVGMEGSHGNQATLIKRILFHPQYDEIDIWCKDESYRSISWESMIEMEVIDGEWEVMEALQ